MLKFTTCWDDTKCQRESTYDGKNMDANKDGVGEISHGAITVMIY